MFGKREAIEEPEIHNAGGVCVVQDPMGCGGLCADTTVEESDDLADGMGSGAAGHLLGQLGDPLRIALRSEAHHRCRFLLPHLLFHDPHRLCPVSRKHRGH